MMARVQILDKGVCISHSAYTIEKGMHQIVGQTGFFNLDTAICL